jgi:hypothetical protein
MNETTINIRITIDLDSNKADVVTEFKGYPTVPALQWKAHETFLTHLLYTVSMHVMHSIEEHVVQLKKDMN